MNPKGPTINQLRAVAKVWNDGRSIREIGEAMGWPFDKAEYRVRALRVSYPHMFDPAMRKRRQALIRARHRKHESWRRDDIEYDRAAIKFAKAIGERRFEDDPRSRPFVAVTTGNVFLNRSDVRPL